MASCLFLYISLYLIFLWIFIEFQYSFFIHQLNLKLQNFLVHWKLSYLKKVVVRQRIGMIIVLYFFVVQKSWHFYVLKLQIQIKMILSNYQIKKKVQLISHNKNAQYCLFLFVTVTVRPVLLRWVSVVFINTVCLTTAECV